MSKTFLIKNKVASYILFTEVSEAFTILFLLHCLRLQMEKQQKFNYFMIDSCLFPKFYTFIIQQPKTCCSSFSSSIFYVFFKYEEEESHIVKLGISQQWNKKLNKLINYEI